MPKILILLLLLAGIGVGVFTPREGNFNLSPSAALAGITFVDEKNNPSKESSSLEVKVALSAPWPTLPNINPPKEVDAVDDFEKEEQKENKNQSRDRLKIDQKIKISGKFLDEKGNPFKEGSISATCRQIKPTITEGQFNFEFLSGRGFCLRAKPVPGYRVIASNSPFENSPRSYERQVAGVDCNDPSKNCPNWAMKKRNGKIADLPTDNNFVFTYIRSDNKPIPSRSPKPIPEEGVTTKSVVLSDNPNFLEVSAVYTYEIPYLNDPLITFYKFRECDTERPCERILYAKFKASNGDKKIYSQTIQIVKSSGSPTPQSLVTCDFSKKTENYGCPDGFTCYQTGMPVCIGENCPKPSKQYCQPIVSDKPGSEDGSVACTQDAKLCPDGKTYVSRTSPSCEFAPCPK